MIFLTESIGELVSLILIVGGLVALLVAFGMYHMLKMWIKSKPALIFIAMLSGLIITVFSIQLFFFVFARGCRPTPLVVMLNF